MVQYLSHPVRNLSILFSVCEVFVVLVLLQFIGVDFLCGDRYCRISNRFRLSLPGKLSGSRCVQGTCLC